MVVILPEARAEWAGLSGAEAAKWAEAERLEAEFRRAEAVRQRRAEIDSQIRAEQAAAAEFAEGRDRNRSKSSKGWRQHSQLAADSAGASVSRSTGHIARGYSDDGRHSG